MRHCEICGSSNQDHIHRQHFLFPGQACPVHYDVVACRGCGFCFAGNIPDQSSLNQFYQASEHHLHADLPLGLTHIHGEFFQFIRQRVKLNSDQRILDIGSGMGHFLNHFKTAGFHTLLGIEPSPAAVRLGKKVYDLEIHAATVDTFTDPEPFDLVTLCGVLEHIANLRDSMRKIFALVKEGGHLFIAVPNAAAFGEAPPAEAFLEFALEHINFFGPDSLDNLLQQFGFEKVAIASQKNDFYGNSYLLALYKKNSCSNGKMTFEQDSTFSLRKYVAHSHQSLQPIIDVVEELATSQTPIVIWGAGSLTSRLFCDTRLRDTNIHHIVDKNKNLHGKMLLNFPIGTPESILSHRDSTVFIASTTYSKEIKEMLIEQYGWTGRIITITSPRTIDRN